VALATAYALGHNGMAQDSKLAMATLTTSCDKGDWQDPQTQNACFLLGTWLRFGQLGNKVDRPKARALFDRLCKSAYTLGCEQLDSMGPK
jgi:TPR repeat protein